MMLLPGCRAASPPRMRPSPHSGAQELGAPLQPKPDSMVQLAPQPSPAVVLPSSHASAPRITPSPHTTAQLLGAPEQP